MIGDLHLQKKPCHNWHQFFYVMNGTVTIGAVGQPEEGDKWLARTLARGSKLQETKHNTMEEAQIAVIMRKTVS